MINSEKFLVLIKYSAMVVGILAIVFLLAIITPYLSKKVDAIIKKHQNEKEETNYDVKGIYDAQIEEKNEKQSDEVKKDG